MRCRFALFAFFFCILAHAQQSGAQTDSLAIYLKDGIGLFQAKSYSAALPLLKKSRSIIESRNEMEQKKYKQLAFFIACCYHYTDRHSEALKYFSEAEQFYKANPDSTMEYSLTLLIGLCHHSLKNYPEALLYFEKALSIVKHKNNAIDYYQILVPLAIMTCGELGDHERGLKICEAADTHCRTTLGATHPKYIELRSKFALVFTAAGYPQAALSFTDTSPSGEGSLYDSLKINILTYEALAYAGNSQHEKAIEKTDSALSLCKKTCGEQNKTYANLLCNKATYHIQLSDFSTSISLLKKALEIYDALGMQSSSSYVNASSSLILAMTSDGIENHGAELIKYTSSTAAILKKHFPAYSSEQTLFLDVLVHFLVKSGEYKFATQIQEGLFTHIKYRHPEHSAEYISQLLTLASCKFAINEDISPLIPEMRKAYRIIASRYEKSHYLYETYTSQFLDYYLFADLYSEAKKYAMDIVPIINKKTTQSFLYLGAKERAAFREKYDYLYSRRIPCLCLRLKNDADIAECAYDAQLMSKNLLLAAETDFKEQLLNSGDDEALKLFDELQATQQQLNKLYESQATLSSTLLDSLEQLAFRQEKALINRSKLYGDYTQNLRINWKDVQKKLGAQDIAIEFFSVDLGNDSTMYAALTLTKTDKSPQTIPLFEQKELERIKKENYYQSGELASLIIRPMQERLSGMKNIYFAPAGELHNIAIENIQHWDKAAQLSDHWDFYRLS